MLIIYEDKYLDEIINLWNQNVEKDRLLKPWTKDYFKQKFLSNPHFNKELFIMYQEDNKIIGIGHASYKSLDSIDPGFISFILVDQQHQRQGIGSSILKALEDKLKTYGKTFVRNLFLSPFNMEWYIEGHYPHDHPGMPAVAQNTDYYFLLMNNGYNIDGQQQDVYYQDIRSYQIPDKIRKTIEENKQIGFNITLYDESKHHGFKSLFEALNNKTWLEVVENNLSKKDPLPMLIIEKEGKILGWTGPLITEKSKRGYFAGIGVHPDVQGHGLGKALFSSLIDYSRRNGAEFMSLFTGHLNPARNIYLGAGFKIIKSFSVLKKNL